MDEFTISRVQANVSLLDVLALSFALEIRNIRVLEKFNVTKARTPLEAPCEYRTTYLVRRFKTFAEEPGAEQKPLSILNRR